MKPPSPKLTIVYLTAIIVLAESAIVYLFLETPYDLEFFQHAATLAVLSIPFIYLIIIRPYVVARIDLIDQIEHLGHHDQLTDLPNRRLVSEFVEKMMSSFVRHNSYGALLYIDMDGFKIINDYHGYDVGDAILIGVARRLMSLVRAEDIVGRVGGNEFVVAIDQLGINEEKANSRALMVLERIQRELSRPIDINNKTLHIEASIGICVLTPEQTSVESVLKDADTEMRRTRKARKMGQ